MIASDFSCVCTSDLSVCRIGDSPTTMTVSETAPTSIVTSTRAISLIVTGTLFRATSRNPASVTFTSYGPGSTLMMLYAPSELVVVSRVRLVSLLTIVTVAPGMTAPVPSRTTPTTLP